MTVQIIEIQETEEHARPSVRLAPVPFGDVWQFAGPLMNGHFDAEPEGVGQDLNLAVQVAAARLAKKISSRGIKVEVTIAPLIPPTGVRERHLVPSIIAIAENASAAVEPGPGPIVITTWWRGRHVGVDAVGVGGSIPAAIRENLMRPGFTTRIADWDTGFGLHEANNAAAVFGSHVELLELDNGVGFRLAIPLKYGTPASPPEVMHGLLGDGEVPFSAKARTESWSFLPTLLPETSVEHVEYARAIEA